MGGDELFAKGQVVRSSAGRDRDYLLAVTATDSTYVYVCDGKERPLRNPKRKSPNHVELTNHKITDDSMATDRSLRKALRIISETEQAAKEAGVNVQTG